MTLSRLSADDKAAIRPILGAVPMPVSCFLKIRGVS